MEIFLGSHISLMSPPESIIPHAAFADMISGLPNNKYFTIFHKVQNVLKLCLFQANIKLGHKFLGQNN